MTNFTPRTWVNGGSPPISAANLQAMDDGIDTAHSELQAHLDDPVDAHDASAISNVAAGNLVATTVQAAVDELDTEKVAKAGDTMSGTLLFSDTGNGIDRISINPSTSSVAGNENRLIWSRTDNWTPTAIGQGYGVGSNFGGYLSFYTHPDNGVLGDRTSAIERMRILAIGTVGIGQSSPSAKLDIVATDAENTVALEVNQEDAAGTIAATNIINAGTGYGLFIDQNGNGPGIYVDSEATNQHVISCTNAGIGSGVLVTQEGNGVGVQVVNAGTGDGLFIDQNGNGVALHIDNAGTNDAVIVEQNGVLDAYQYPLQVFSGAANINNGALSYFNVGHASSIINVLEGVNTGTGNCLFLNQDGNGVALHIDNDGTANSLTIEGTTATDLVVLKSGFVGIGTTVPTSKLHIGNESNPTIKIEGNSDSTFATLNFINDVATRDGLAAITASRYTDNYGTQIDFAAGKSSAEGGAAHNLNTVMSMKGNGSVGIGQSPTSTVALFEILLAGVPAAANNAAAAAAGVAVGGIYRTNADPSVLCIRSA